MHFRPSLPFSDLLRDTRLLDAKFFGRESPVVARELIGCVLVTGECAGRIVETEAYLGERDGASHAFRGPTPRTLVMFGPPGFTYVYFIYGMYHCLNFVTGEDGIASAVLVRALEPLSGVEAMRARRPKVKRWEDLASGPGKLTLAMGIRPEHNGLQLGKGIMQVRQFREGPPARVSVSARVGVKACADWPLRFFEAGNPCVSRSPLNAAATVLSPDEAFDAWKPFVAAAAERPAHGSTGRGVKQNAKMTSASSATSRRPRPGS
ncbi:MAG: DNA-3-methyladenine glycosylase [Bryobacterales bacterium]|nr:DNA-3-methyladenine glycosylase [Bryobacterales bacterium]